MSHRRRAVSAPFKFPEVRDRVQNALLLSGLTMLSSFPWFLYQFRHLTGAVFPRPPTDEQLELIALGQSIIVFALALLCSLVGFLYAERLSLPGFGRVRDLIRWLPLGLMLGVLLTPLSYYLLDRELLPLVPEMFPRPWPWALAWMAGSALSQEVVARFGLLTIGVYLLDWLNYRRGTWLAIIVISAFGTVSTYLFLTRLELDQRLLPYQIIMSLVSVFVFQWIFCEVYLRRGLLAVAGLHFGLLARLLIYSIVI